MAKTAIRAIGTALPPYQHGQTDLARFMKNVLGADRALSRRIDYLYHRSQIHTRSSCIPLEFYPSGSDSESFPTTQERMGKYQEEALPLCQDAIADALNQLHAPDLSEVTHLIVVSCTGFYSPGLDVHLVKALGLSPDVERTFVGFMGCHAAFNGIRLADYICRSDPAATVLLVCVELCTLHFQPSRHVEHLIANCIFADGAAAAFFKGSRSQREGNDLIVRDSLSWIDDDSLGDMTWKIGDSGFEMYVSLTVAKIIETNLSGYIGKLLGPSATTVAEVDFWAVHPGGRSIIDAVQGRLDLSPCLLEDSRAVLHDHGNMSSPSVLFVLKRMLGRLHDGEDFNHCVALAFGPGLTLEGCLFTINS